MGDPEVDFRSWKEPGVFAAGEGVFRIPLPIPDVGLHAVNIYIIENDDGPVLIDSGQAMTKARDTLESALKEIGYSFTDISAFVLTHVHRDHYTHAIELRREFGTKIYAGAGERPNLDRIRDPNYDRYGSQLDLLRQSGAPGLAALNTGLSDGIEPDLWEYPDEWLSDGDAVRMTSRTLRIVETPGHTRGHIVGFDEARHVIFSGDHVLPHITPSLGFEPDVPERPLGDYLTSLNRLLEFDDARVLPAHGPIVESLHERVCELLKHHDDRLNSTLGRVSHQPVSPADVAAKLSWTRRGRSFTELGPIDQMLAILETKAHLDVLADDGSLVRRIGCQAEITFSSTG